MPTPRRTQVDRSRTTRSVLIGTARPLFADRGYQGVPAEEIMQEAGVTRGALYHHFGGKAGLFRAVFEEIEEEITTTITERVDDLAPAEAMTTALGAFLDLCARPDVVRVALMDAPAVLGWPEWREAEARHGLGLIRLLLDRAHGAGLLAATPSPALAQILLGAVIEGVLTIAHAADLQEARSDVEAALSSVLSGLLQQ